MNINGAEIYADVSEWQVGATNAYTDAGYRVLCIRSNDGSYRDKKFESNYRWCVKACDEGRLDFFIVYAYWRPDWETTSNLHMDMVKAAGGPHPRMVSMIDAESGGNPRGDHSDGLNKTFYRWASWLGNPKRVIGYANKGDFTSMWKVRPDGLRIVGAGYGSNPNLPGQIAHQYTDGQGYGGGLPEGAPPFGNCDMNAANGYDSLSFAAACGILISPSTTPSPPPPTTMPSDDVLYAAASAIAAQFVGSST